MVSAPTAPKAIEDYECFAEISQEDTKPQEKPVKCKPNQFAVTSNSVSTSGGNAWLIKKPGNSYKQMKQSSKQCKTKA